jgi:hypothetical protein
MIKIIIDEDYVNFIEIIIDNEKNITYWLHTSSMFIYANKAVIVYLDRIIIEL